MPRFTILTIAFIGCAQLPEGGPLAERSASTAARTFHPGCPGAGYARIQPAIDAAAPGDVIEVCAGTYAERLTISKDLTIRSRGGPGATTIDAAGGGRALSVAGGANVVVTGFTLRGGTSAGVGGNVRCENSSLQIRDSVLLDGDALYGGGLGMLRCDGVVEGNTFLDNRAGSAGGGLYALGSPTVRGNTFDANHADQFGGGAYVVESFGDVADNVVIRNTSGDDGGGIYVDFGAPRVSHNTFEANDSSDEAGGLRVKLSEAVITDNVFTANHADYRGGAVKISHDEVVMIGNTYVENTTWVTGGAVLLYESASVLKNERYVSNTAPETGGALAIMEGWGGVTVEDSTFEGNEADEGGHLYIALTGHRTTLQRVDFVGGSADRGGAVYAHDSDIAIRNTLFESNDAAQSGGALYLDGVTGSVANGVALWNSAPDASVLRVKNGVGLDVSNTVLFANGTGAAVRLSEGVAPTLRYDCFFENSSDFSGMEGVIGLEGNLAVRPEFVDPPSGDYALGAESAMRDAGDPAVRDRDGSRSDIGLFGGPGA